MRKNAAMDESSSEKRTGLIIVFLITVAIAGAWYVVQRTGAVEAIDETVDVFVPDRRAQLAIVARLEPARFVDYSLTTR